MGCILQHFFLKLRSLMFHILKCTVLWDFFFIWEKNPNCAPSQLLETENIFHVLQQLWVHCFYSQYSRHQRPKAILGLEKADDECVHGDLCLHSDHRPIPLLSIFMMNNHYFWSIEKTKDCVLQKSSVGILVTTELLAGEGKLLEEETNGPSCSGCRRKLPSSGSLENSTKFSTGRHCWALSCVCPWESPVWKPSRLYEVTV